MSACLSTQSTHATASAMALELAGTARAAGAKFGFAAIGHQATIF